MAIPYNIRPEENLDLPTPEEWKEFLLGLSVGDVFLTDIRAHRYKEWREPPYRVHEPKREPVFQFVNEKIFVVLEKFSLRVSAKGVPRFFTVRIDAGVAYRTEVPLEEKYFHHIFLYVHTPVIWPYFRRWIRDLSMEFGFREHIHLPLIAIGEVKTPK